MTLILVAFALGAWFGWRLCDRTRFRRLRRSAWRDQR